MGNRTAPPPNGLDDTAALDAEIVACNGSGGGIVELQPGTYLVSNVFVRERVWLRGAGVGATTLRLLDGADNHVVSFQFDRADQAVTDLAIDGNRANQASYGVHGIRLHGGLRSRVERVALREVCRYGIGVGHTAGTERPLTDSLVSDVWVEGVGKAEHGVGDGIDAKRTLRCLFRNLRVAGVVGRGVDVRGQFTAIENVWVEGTGSDGITFRSVEIAAGVPAQPFHHRHAANLTAVNCGGMGVWIEAFDEGQGNRGRVSVANATALGAGNRGFYVGGDAEQVALTNCRAEGCAQHGFQLNVHDAAGFRAVLTNCWAVGNGLSGFTDQADANGPGTVFVGCVAEGNAGPGFQDEGGRCVYVGCVGAPGG